MLRSAVALAVLALVAAGCAQATAADPAGPTASPTPSPTPTPDPTPSPTPGNDGRLIGRGTVIDQGSGPKLCHFVLTSYPPQCGSGVDLVGWRWPERGVERAGRTTWGEFAVVGTYDGQRFRVEKTAEPVRMPGSKHVPRGTPCPEPAGGWRAPDPARATYKTQEQAIRLAERRPGYADAWVEELGRGDPTDPTRTVLNFSFTEDLAGAERAIRTVWGGPLCVSKGERTHAELQRIQNELRKTPGLMGSSFGFGHVKIQVIFDDGTLQRKLDRTYGQGLVRVESYLKPYAE